jgi:serine/threonine-protein kinase ATR
VQAAAGGAAAAREIENEDAKRVLRVIEDRLRGVYNLRLPPKRHGASPLNSDASQGIADTDEASELPLSVQGQVHRLLQEATSHANLAQMYIGWMPWA